MTSPRRPRTGWGKAGLQLGRRRGGRGRTTERTSGSGRERESKGTSRVPEMSVREHVEPRASAQTNVLRVRETPRTHVLGPVAPRGPRPAASQPAVNQVLRLVGPRTTRTRITTHRQPGPKTCRTTSTPIATAVKPHRPARHTALLRTPCTTEGK